METSRLQSAAQKLRVAFDLHSAGVSMMRARLRREHPQAEATELTVRLTAWLRTRPGALWGDTVGRRREVPPE